MVPDLGVGYIKLPDILDQFAKDLIPAEKQLDNDGKLLETCLSKNSAFMHYYDERKIRLHSLVKFFRLEVDRVRGEKYKQYNENYSRSITIQMMNKYIDAEEDYLNVYKILIEVEEVYENYVSAVDGFKQRHYELTNMTKLRIANLEFSEI